MAKSVSKSKKVTGSILKKKTKVASSHKTVKVVKAKSFQYWGLVTMNKNEAFIHMAFDTEITKKGLDKWSDGYLSSLLEAKAMVLNASIVNDWRIEKIEFAREDTDWREQDFPFWVGKNEPDKIYKEIIRLNS